jgi:hypothetical protein
MPDKKWHFNQALVKDLLPRLAAQLDASLVTLI